MMKMFPRLLVTAVTVMFITGLLIMPVKADAQELALTPTEEYVKSEILVGREADVSLFKEGDEKIRGSMIVAWWNEDDFQKIPFFKIKNAVIDGDLNAEGITLPFMVGFVHCEFTGNINLESAKTKTFNIENDYELDDPDPDSFDKIKAPSIINGSIRMGRMIVDGDLALYGSKFVGPVTLFDAHINNNLYAKNSKFLGTEWRKKESTYAFELWTIYVGEVTEFTGSTFNGEVMAANAEFGQDIRFQNVTFNETVNFKNSKVGEFANFAKAKFNKEAIFESGVVGRDIQFAGAEFNGDSNFNNLSVGRFLNFSNIPLNLEDYKKEKRPELGTVFNGPVKFEGVQVGRVLDFSNAKSTKAFTVHLAKVDGQTLFTNFTSPAGLDLSHSQFGDLRITGEGGKFEVLKLDSTKINGDLYLQDVAVIDFSAQDLSVTNSTTFIDLTTKSNLDLSNASLGSFIISAEKFWPEPLKPESEKPENKTTYGFNLRNTMYTDINFANSTGDRLDYQEFNSTRLKEMVRDSLYSPQAYRTLKQFLTEKGRSGDAADVEFKRKERERTESLEKWSSPWLLSWFLLIFSGYGQHPEYALGWGMLVVVFGAIFFQLTGTYTDDKKVVILNPKKFVYCLLYSAALFFPLKVLGFAEKWEPQSEGDDSFFRMYQIIHAILGLIIAPTAILAFGGWIK